MKRWILVLLVLASCERVRPIVDYYYPPMPDAGKADAGTVDAGELQQGVR